MDNTALSQKYQQKTDIEHILSNPDTYIGSVEEIDNEVWVYNDDNSITLKTIKYNPGLFKLFDEGIVNCRDHFIRTKQAILSGDLTTIPVTYINVTIEEDGTIIMINDGSGIDIAEHPEYTDSKGNKIWIPELIFGHLRTSTNYDKSEKKIVGGKNGFGFKLVLIWSLYGSVETVDSVRGLKYIQEFKNNLSDISNPIITKTKVKPYTKITFKPDYVRLGTVLSSDIIALFKRRVYDIAAVTNLKVKWNSVPIEIKNFQQYIGLYNRSETTSTKKIIEQCDRWEYAVTIAPLHEFTQISFVNGINTNKGGKHVEYILNQIVKKLIEFIEKKKKIKVNPSAIKEQIMLFLNCDIENPSFDSQTKDFMNTPSSKFGSKCEISDKFIESVAKLGIMDLACELTSIKESKAAKKTDGSKTKKIIGIPKLIDANWAGTVKSNQCTLILCEGDSAKSGIVSGLSSDDRNSIGVYPLKGKLMNVRGETVLKISSNKEIAEIKKILGLENGKIYTEGNISSLRYRKVLFLTDQDRDGYHIKGLGINLFDSEWPSLLKVPLFIGFMNTPILKARKGTSELLFYNEGEYETWKEKTNEDTSKYTIKYYKGLGTSTGKEFKEYFANKKMVSFDGETAIIDMPFNKKRASDRKDWLNLYQRNLYVDTSKETISYSDFVNKELIHFSKYDCDRSIPNLMDGLKTSQRKILYCAFKKNLTTEIKVAQFSGYVSENSGYHHGEASLNGAIVGMAQDFVGSNNINLLMPNGQFGSRLHGGQDSASERYIFTQLNKLTRLIYPQADDAVLKYLDDDGFIVEPIWYAPIIPMVLVNGCKGIGTGFSTEVLQYNPLDLINYLKDKLSAVEKFNGYFNGFPYYKNFTGTITLSDGKYIVKGKYEKIGEDKIRITELPIGVWTEDFKEHLESLMETSKSETCKSETDSKTNKKKKIIVKDYDDLSTDVMIDFTVTLVKGMLGELEGSNLESKIGSNLEKVFKLSTTMSITNMHLFDANDKLKKYDTVSSIIDDYYITRLQLYQVRKDHIILVLEKELLILSNKVRYIRELLASTIDLRRKKKEEVTQLLTSKKYTVFDSDTDYKYLVKLPMDSVTEENIAQLEKSHSDKLLSLEQIKNTLIEHMWLQELDILKKNIEEEYSKKVKVTKNKLLKKVK